MSIADFFRWLFHLGRKKPAVSEPAPAEEQPVEAEATAPVEKHPAVEEAPAPAEEQPVVEEVPEPAEEQPADEQPIVEEAEPVREEEPAPIEEQPVEAEATTPAEEQPVVEEEPAPAETETEEIITEDAITGPEVEESVPAVEEVKQSESEEVEPTSVLVQVRTAGGKVFVRMTYNRSFTAKIIQASDAVKNYYSAIKNELLKYGAKNRISWKHETFKKGRKLLARFAIRGKTLGVYLALNPADYAGSKYKLSDVSSKAKNAEVPALYKIKNGRRCNYAKELIAVLAEANGLTAGEEQNTDYAVQYPYEETQALIEKQLIKLISYKDAEEEAAATCEELSEEVIELPAEEVPVEETVIEVPAQEEPEQLIEEPAEEEPEQPVEVSVQAEKSVAPEEIIESVNVYEAEEQIPDEEVEHYVNVGRRVSNKTKKAIVNIDTLSKYFKKNEKATIDEIIKRVPEIGKKVTYIKVLGRGTLDKALTVEADDFSPSAIKMIVLTGGNVIRTKKN